MGEWAARMGGVAHEGTGQSGECTVDAFPGCCVSMRGWGLYRMPRWKFARVAKNLIASASLICSVAAGKYSS